MSWPRDCCLLTIWGYAGNSWYYQKEWNSKEHKRQTWLTFNRLLKKTTMAGSHGDSQATRGRHTNHKDDYSSTLKICTTNQTNGASMRNLRWISRRWHPSYHDCSRYQIIKDSQRSAEPKIMKNSKKANCIKILLLLAYFAEQPAMTKLDDKTNAHTTY